MIWALGLHVDGALQVLHSRRLCPSELVLLPLHSRRQRLHLLDKLLDLHVHVRCSLASATMMNTFVPQCTAVDALNQNSYGRADNSHLGYESHQPHTHKLPAYAYMHLLIR